MARPDRFLKPVRSEQTLAGCEALAGQNLAGQAQAGQLMQAVLKEAFNGKT
jgi:hypothetical protein